MENYKISCFVERGDELLICLQHTEKPVFIEHFFTEDEKLDQSGTIKRLISDLQTMADEYIDPTPIVSKIDELNVILDK